MDLSFDKMKKLGTALRGKFDQYEKDRRPVELQWAINLRQYLRQYDPDIEKLIPEERSHVYPGDTRGKVKDKVTKMMEMMFPSQERNWELAVSPVPSIPEKDLDKIIRSLEQQEVAAAQAEQRAPGSVTSDQIERAVKEFAEKRKDNMELEIADQLADPLVDYPQLAKRVLRSGTIYGVGVAKTGQVRTQTERVFKLDKQTGRYAAVTTQSKRPYPEYARIWNIYPDLSALIWEDQEGLFEEVSFNRHDFAQLAKRSDFRSEVIKEYLKQHRDGNYVTKNYESELHAITDSTNLIDRNKRRYQVYRWFGFVSAHDLVDAGIEVPEEQLDEDVLADVWIIDNVVIKAEVATFGTRPSDCYHAYIPAEDEDAGLTGTGLPEDIRDSQMSICASTRACMDNMAATAGPIFIVNKDLMPSGRSNIGAVHAFQTIEREGVGVDAQADAIEALFVPSHVSEILSIVEMNRKQLEIESKIPSWTMGNIQTPLGEAFRTSGNMSQMTGGANMVMKDDVRAFDRWTDGVIGSMLRWNMEFNPRDDIKGDFQARAKGNLSLVAKEVRGAALDQFMQTLTPEDRAMFDMYGINIDRLKSRDLPVDRMLPKDEALRAVQAMQAAQQQAQQIEQGLTQAKTGDLQAKAAKTQVDTQIAAQAADATLREILSRVDNNIAMAKSTKDKNQLENLKILLSTVLQGEGAKANEQQGSRSSNA
jgi:hypothetical protein